MSVANDLRAQLEAVTEDLWWSSENDYPVKVVWQSAEVSAEIPAEIPAEINEVTVRRLAGCNENAQIQIVDVEDFFKRATTPESWHTPEDKAQLTQLKALKSLLVDSLTHLQVYRCGAVEITAYVIGTAPDGSIAGVTTTLIET